MLKKKKRKVEGIQRKVFRRMSASNYRWNDRIRKITILLEPQGNNWFGQKWSLDAQNTA